MTKQWHFIKFYAIGLIETFFCILLASDMSNNPLKFLLSPPYMVYNPVSILLAYIKF